MYTENIYTLHYKSRRKKKRHKFFIIFIIICLLLLLSILAIKFLHSKSNYIINNIQYEKKIKKNINKNDINKEAKNKKDKNKEDKSDDNSIDNKINEAKRVALSYDYDKAISLLKGIDNYEQNSDITELINNYENIKTKLVKQNINEITHVFFHTLIVDPSKAFDGDSKEMGYNEVMTTVKEFKDILQSMYDRGFVLVRMHDMAYEVEDQDGNKRMQEGNIMLPEGKKAFVMSQDDVCYYEYMVGDGFASRLVIGDNNKVTTQMDKDDGTSVIGDYDLIPILNSFIEKHPDFSYRGAKAIIAVTGYNGVFGYRTDESYEGKNPNIEEDRRKVTDIANALREDGFELASHSWGHRHLGRIALDEFKQDTDKWEKNVGSLIGHTDMLLYPFGTDVSDWHPYVDTNERYKYLYDKGFRYFCTVDSNKYWVQLGKDYLRQGRRNLDGYRMWRDLTEPDKPRLSDLFDVKKVFDKSRPTPVGAIRS